MAAYTVVVTENNLIFSEEFIKCARSGIGRFCAFYDAGELVFDVVSKWGGEYGVTNISLVDNGEVYRTNDDVGINVVLVGDQVDMKCDVYLHGDSAVMQFSEIIARLFRLDKLIIHPSIESPPEEDGECLIDDFDGQFGGSYDA